MVAALRFLLLVLGIAELTIGDDDLSKAGGAGYALQFHDHSLMITKFNDFPKKQLTFEAWVSTADFCHPSSIISYAKDSHSDDAAQRVADYNAFVVFNPEDVIACRGYQYMLLRPDTENQSCASQFLKVEKNGLKAAVADRTNKWKHLAVTWDGDDFGVTSIYIDGKLVSQAHTNQTDPLPEGGSLLIGGDQDCFGGCSDPHQSFYGALDEVRIWKVVRTREQIAENMKKHDFQPKQDGLVAYWKFNDPADEAQGEARRFPKAKDSSGNGNDLPLATIPTLTTDNKVLSKDGKQSIKFDSLHFWNNYAANTRVKGMPTQDFTVEFWARTQAIQNISHSTPQNHTEFFSYATTSEEIKELKDGGVGQASEVFMDDAIRIGKYYNEYRTALGSLLNKTTRGSISVHVNSNHDKNLQKQANWIDFHADWVDDDWHHIAVTWDQPSGNTTLYFDGEPAKPFWRANQGYVQAMDERLESTMVPQIANGTSRQASGSLVLGQHQKCFGGCFSPSNALRGEIAALRIWKRVRTQDDIKRDMFSIKPANEDGLVSMYNMKVHQHKTDSNKQLLLDNRSTNSLILGSEPPHWILSTVPLVKSDGQPVDKPKPGAAGYGLRLNDQQTLILSEFKDFPTEAVSVEFWMNSVDTCRPATVLSYATGNFQFQDNMFLISNYNDWTIGVNEDEGKASDHTAGFGSTDGRWHHIAVTWDMETGDTRLYDNGHLMWIVTRNKGKKVEQGGTLVIGREQDCVGGCFDSAAGAFGDYNETAQVYGTKATEFGPQDFFGVIEQMRIWSKVLTPGEVATHMRMDDGTYEKDQSKYGSFAKPGPDPKTNGLVAYWKFDDGPDGHKVMDATDNGHDLTIMNDPQWEVVRWMSKCGDGRVEGWEQCDDGNTKDGDGCSKICQVEDGYHCTRASPSVCVKSSTSFNDMPDYVPVPGTKAISREKHRGHYDSVSPPTNQASEGDAGGKRRRSGFWTFFWIVLVFGVVGGLAYWKRYQIFDRFPVLESAVGSVRDTFSRAFGGTGGATYQPIATDQEGGMGVDYLDSAPMRQYSQIPSGQ